MISLRSQLFWPHNFSLPDDAVWGRLIGFLYVIWDSESMILFCNGLKSCFGIGGFPIPLIFLLNPCMGMWVFILLIFPSPEVLDSFSDGCNRDAIPFARLLPDAKVWAKFHVSDCFGTSEPKCVFCLATFNARQKVYIVCKTRDPDIPNLSSRRQKHGMKRWNIWTGCSASFVLIAYQYCIGVASLNCFTTSTMIRMKVDTCSQVKGLINWNVTWITEVGVHKCLYFCIPQII